MIGDWFFGAGIARGISGIILFTFGALIKRTSNGKPLDRWSRQFAMALGAYVFALALGVALGVALKSSSWQVPYRSAVELILILTSFVPLGLVLYLYISLMRQNALPPLTSNNEHADRRN
jgi:magnesium-transporting ATPase (P-type)